jgi:hypothetical protein
MPISINYTKVPSMADIICHEKFPRSATYKTGTTTIGGKRKLSTIDADNKETEIKFNTMLCLTCLEPSHGPDRHCATKADTYIQLASDLPTEVPEFSGVGLLAAKHPHLLDQTIIFIESSHTYYVRWFNNRHLYTSNDTISVSKFVHNYFEHFDPDVAIAKMQKGSRWGKFHPHWGKSAAEIKNEWAHNGKLARDQGTQLHYLLECFYNGSDLRPWANFKVIRQFIQWHYSCIHGKLVPFRTEMRLRSQNVLRLTGTIDMLYIQEDHPPPAATGGVLLLHMKDWKFSKEIKTDNRYSAGTGLCSHLPDCNYSHYCLQLNTYQTLLEDNYHDFHYHGHVYNSVRIVSRELVVFHDTKTSVQLVQLPRWETLVKSMMDARQEFLKPSDKEDLVCALSDTPTLQTSNTTGTV